MTDANQDTPARLERLWGWSMATSAPSWVYRPTSVDGIRNALEQARADGRSVAFRGAGQSYGDAALNRDNACIDVTGMCRILAWDAATGVVRVEPGVTIGELWKHTIADGWWPAVVPGTMHATLGGAAAMNVHGKNNWKVGPIGEHILAFDLLLPSRELCRCSPSETPELFHAAIGGLGMLGCFTSLTLQLKRVHSGLVAVEAVAVRDVEEMIATFEARHADADYLVGWVDGAARGNAIGRGIVHHANDLAPGEDPHPAETLRVTSQNLPETLVGIVPKSIMWRLLRPFMNPPGVRAVNLARYHLSRLRGRHRFQQSHAAFAFLFDYIPNWKLACGPGGFIQYQSFIPTPHAARVFRAQLALAHEAGLIPYIGVFKRHRADAFLLSHGVDGYSLAIELKVTARNRPAVWALAARFDELVVTAGGRFYFAKDNTLTRASLAGFLREPRVRRFLALKRELDPEGRLQTDLYRRLLART